MVMIESVIMTITVSATPIRRPNEASMPSPLPLAGR
jgi:hypothetical protein